MSSRGITFLAIGLLLLTSAMRVAYVQRTLVVVDEFEHLHAAYLVAQGETPYVDFFEHHTPLVYYLAAAVISMREPSFETIIRARYLASVFTGLTIVLAWLWVRRLFGRTEALVVACLLLGNFFLFARGSLSYLDTYAAPFLMLSALLLTNSRGRPVRSFASGAALGLAILCTQKAVVASFAPAVFFLGGAITQSETGHRQSGWLRALVAYAFGGLAAAGLLPLLLGVHALDNFWHDAVAINLAWKARHFPAKELMTLGGTDGLVYLLALIGASTQAWLLLRRKALLDEQAVPVLFLAALGLGIFLLPVVWEEYFVLLVPFAAITAGVTLVSWSRKHLRLARAFGLLSAGCSRRASLAVLALFGVLLFNLIGRKLVPEDSLSWTAFFAVVGLWLLLGSVIRTTRPYGAYQPALGLLFILIFPVVEQADWIAHNSNEQQRRQLAYVLQNTSPTDTVLDGYSGLGVFRPHAYRYWFLHEEMRAMLSRRQAGAKIVDALERNQTPLIIADRHVRALPGEVAAYIAANYEDTPFPQIKRRMRPAMRFVSLKGQD